MSVQRLHVGKRLSEVAIHNGTVYLAGQIAEDATQNIEGQTREVLGHIAVSYTHLTLPTKA